MKIAPIVNTLIGVLLVYAAILTPSFVIEPRSAALTLVVGAALALLALVSRRQPIGAWAADTVAILGLTLIAQALLRWTLALPAVVNTWSVFWIGFLTAVLSLWTLLYRRSTPEPDQV